MENLKLGKLEPETEDNDILYLTTWDKKVHRYRDLIVRVDGEAALMLNELSEQTNRPMKEVASEMIKFAYEKTVVVGK